MNCKHCGYEHYEISHVYYGNRQQVWIVQCGQCRTELWPIAVDRFTTQSETASECEAIWNKNNATPTQQQQTPSKLSTDQAYGPINQFATSGTASTMSQQAVPGAVPDEECICRGNWRRIVKEYEGLFDKNYLSYDGKEFSFFGLVHTNEDYYYGMYSEANGLRLLSCVGDIEAPGHGYTLSTPKPQEPGG